MNYTVVNGTGVYTGVEATTFLTVTEVVVVSMVSAILAIVVLMPLYRRLKWLWNKVNAWINPVCLMLIVGLTVLGYAKWKEQQQHNNWWKGTLEWLDTMDMWQMLLRFTPRRIIDTYSKM